MNRIKIIHAADFHFDSPFKELSSSYGEKRNEDIKKSFKKIINLANEECVQILLLCGDIFDNSSIKKSTLEFLKSEIETLNNTKVFIAAGNHDPLSDKSFYKVFNWPKNVFIFSKELEYVVLEDIKTVVYGYSFGSNYENTSLLKNFNIPQIYKGYINIMALHGEVTSSTGNEYNPITINEIGKSGLNYLALGHRHGFSGIKREDDTFYAYSGCPEGRGFDETGEKGIIFGEVYKDGVNLNFLPLCERTYNSIEVDISNCTNQEQVINSILFSLKDEDTDRNFYKVILTGYINGEMPIKIKTIEYRVKDRLYYIKIKDETRVNLDIDIIKKENSLRGIYYRKVAERLLDATEEEKIYLEEALKIGLEALMEEEVKGNDY
ncbi:metallophosphoesterase family protein [Clostridium sp. 'White wine YQ']|uniref:metallophosphoesterase family protein n=1 Tax=Clostridium sp. 'White wine YQ' TaxID=3027474 RepID=UPI002365222D|nr:DNA repair exonuclease [Clostridium sp. 'White wine YQ']MDD7792794.1 DNA repair exonuclease [Clostridium sp. 'White wine YQ']